MKITVLDYNLKNGYGNRKIISGSSILSYVFSNPEKISWQLFANRYNSYQGIVIFAPCKKRKIALQEFERLKIFKYLIIRCVKFGVARF